MARDGLRKRSLRRTILLFVVVGVIVSLAFATVLLVTLGAMLRETKYESARRAGLDLVRYVGLEVQRTMWSKPGARKIADIAPELQKLIPTLRSLAEIVRVRISDEKGWIVAAQPPKDVEQHDQLIYRFAWRRNEQAQFDTSSSPPKLLLFNVLVVHGRLIGHVTVVCSMRDAEHQVMMAEFKFGLAITGLLLALYVVIGGIIYHAASAVAEIQKEAEENRRLAALGDLAAGVAHEIRNPLNTIGLTIDFVERYAKREGIDLPPVAAEKFEIVRMEIQRLTRIIEDFIHLARPAAPRFQNVKIAEVILRAVQLIEEEARKQNVSIEVDAQDELQVHCDPDQMAQVALNILQNACQAMTEGGKITVRVRRVRGRVVIEFADTGPGIPEEYLERIFEPYVSTKKNGLGLGLPLCHNIVVAHGGTITVCSRQGQGATFVVNLPIGTSSNGERNNPHR